ncbi:MAG: TonB-dependent siderophore receptor [Rubrivivax sp.]|nr:TonB-dependent siderophore receptor [Rubrivivax sp.]
MATHLPSPAPVALAALLAICHGATAQTTITVTGRNEPPIGVGGFGGAPARSPLQATQIGADALRDAGVAVLGGITPFDAGIADAYNAQGYWSGLSVRGFTIDPRQNVRRDGLPINAETSLPLANKERVEVLKGTSGIQAGTSAPGGLVNLVVKRPTTTLRRVTLDVGERGSLAAGVDLSQRFGTEGRFGARVTAEAARLRPELRSAAGNRHLAALALDWVPTVDTRLEFEIERSHQSQPSQPGFSLLGDTLPDARAIDPRINLNNQPWTLPVVLDGRTASVRWTQRLGADWSYSVHGASQRLTNDDRVAFPYGCSNDAATYWADRYCPDGSFDLYDFRSEGERRGTDALDLQLQGRLQTGPVRHRLRAGVLWSRSEQRMQRQAYNYTGAGRIQADLFTPPAPALTDENTNRDERSRELYLRDAMQLAERWQLWTGVRHTRVERESVRTDGSRATDHAQTFTVPWLALAFEPTAGTLVYASWGEGVESEVVPNRSRYVNRGEVLPALKSRQWEAGVKWSANGHDASAALFDIRRPVASDFCDDADRCVRRIDGAQRHRGLELAGGWRQGAWSVRASAMWLQAEREDSDDAALNGLKPTNVPERALKARLSHALGPALSAHADLVHEGRRAVLPGNAIEIGSWTTASASINWRVPLAGLPARVRLGIDNLADRRAWRESPYQFGHAYLMPLQPRTWHASISVDL